MREIQGNLYRVVTMSGVTRIIECETIEQLIEYVVSLEHKTLVSSVTELDFSGGTVRTPKVSIRNNPYYKKLMKDRFN